MMFDVSFSSVHYERKIVSKKNEINARSVLIDISIQAFIGLICLLSIKILTMV